MAASPLSIIPSPENGLDASTNVQPGPTRDALVNRNGSARHLGTADTIGRSQTGGGLVGPGSLIDAAQNASSNNHHSDTGPTISKVPYPNKKTVDAVVDNVVSAGVYEPKDPNNPNSDVYHAAMSPQEEAAARHSIPILLRQMQLQGITDPNQQAYVLATSRGESLSGLQMTENGNGKSVDGIDHYFDMYDNRPDLGNTQPGDGERFKGRGFVQVTGRKNYSDISTQVGLPERTDASGKPVPYLVDHPERLADHDLAAPAMVENMRTGSFTGTSLQDAIPAGQKPGAADFYHARQIINGIVPAPAQRIANSAADYAKILAPRESQLNPQPK